MAQVVKDVLGIATLVLATSLFIALHSWAFIL